MSVRGSGSSARRGSEALALARAAWLRSLAAIRNSPGLLILSFLLGISLWVFVTDTENPTRIDAFPAPVPVEAVNVGDDLAVATQLPPVDVRIAAPEDRWDEISTANFRAYVDLKDLEAREQEVRVQVEVQDISGVRVVDVSPATLIVNLEELVVNEVPVTVRPIGTLPIGYSLDDARAELQSVAAVGPESLVELVREAVAEINVTGLTVGVEQTVNLVPRGAGGGDIRGVRIEPRSVRVSVDVLQTTLPRTLPLRVNVTGDPAPGYRVASVTASPSTVLVQGPINALQQIDALTLPPIDISGAREDIVRAVRIPVPDSVSLAEQTSATVFVSVVPVVGQTRMEVAPIAQDVADGLLAAIETPSVEVLLEGPLPVLNALTPSDVRAVVDMQGVAAGTYTRDVTVQVPEGVSVVSVQPEQVSISLSPQ